MEAEGHEVPEDFFEVLDTDLTSNEPLDVLLHCWNPIFEVEVLEAAGN